MKWASFLFLLSSSLWARPVVLLGYFDAFGSAKFNNSERVAKALAERVNVSSGKFSIRLCSLNTVFDKAMAQFEDCLNELPETPILVVGLGESNCDLKLETIVRNKDKTKGPDNEGNHRDNTVIIPEAPAHYGLRYPLPQMYCALSKRDRADVDVSNSAGSFVCNNTAFQMTHYYSDIMFGFIHVPSQNCRNLERRTENAIHRLYTMLQKGVEYLDTHYLVSPHTPHWSNEVRLPALKKEIDLLQREFANKDKCLSDFFKRARGVDERGFWSYLD